MTGSSELWGFTKHWEKILIRTEHGDCGPPNSRGSQISVTCQCSAYLKSSKQNFMPSLPLLNSPVFRLNIHFEGRTANPSNGSSPFLAKNGAQEEAFPLNLLYIYQTKVSFNVFLLIAHLLLQTSSWNPGFVCHRLPVFIFSLSILRTIPFTVLRNSYRMHWDSAACPWAQVDRHNRCRQNELNIYK